MLKDNDRKLLEQQLIMSMLTSEPKFETVISRQEQSDLFINENNQKIYNSMFNYYVEKDKAPEFDSLYSFMITKEDALTAKDSLMTLSSRVSTFTYAEIDSVINKLVEDSMERQYYTIINNANKTHELNGIELLQSVQGSIFKIIAGKNNQAEANIRKELETIQDRWEAIRSGNEFASEYYRTGISGIDNAILGFRKTSFNVIAGRPGSGKTAFMLQLRRNFQRKGINAGIISLEMPADQLLIRDISEMTEINSRRLELAKYSDAELQKINGSMEILARQEYPISDTAGQTAEKIIATAINWKARKKLDILLIDYLTYIKPSPDMKGMRPDLVIGEICQRFTNFAKTTKVPVVMLSQLNRSVEQTEDKRPNMSHLRESGNIEQDATSIILLYRPSYYGIDPFKQGNFYKTITGEQVKSEEYAEIIIGKSRNGVTGDIPVRYIKEIHRIEPLRVFNAYGVEISEMVDSNYNTNSYTAIQKDAQESFSFNKLCA